MSFYNVKDIDHESVEGSPTTDSNCDSRRLSFTHTRLKSRRSDGSRTEVSCETSVGDISTLEEDFNFKLPRLAAEAAPESISPVTSSISQELGINDQDMHIYQSNAISAKIHSKKLLCPDSKKNHTWKDTVRVSIKKKKGVKIRLFLFPGFTEKDEPVKTVLYIMADVDSRLLQRMQQCAERCWIRVDIVMKDRSTGRKITQIQGHLHPISIDEGQLSFFEVLASHERVKSSACTYVILQIKITVVIAITPYEDYKVEEGEDGFCHCEPD